jgi:Flp pilus assembly protein TadB
MSKRRTPLDPRVRIIQIEQRHKTIRCGFISASITLCIWFITSSIDRITETPPWVAILLAAVGGLIPWVVFVPRHMRRARRQIRELTEQNRLLEEQADDDVRPDARESPGED